MEIKSKKTKEKNKNKARERQKNFFIERKKKSLEVVLEKFIERKIIHWR